MTSTLLRPHPPRTTRTTGAGPRALARDWSEIQERMLVPLYEAVHTRLGVGPGTRLLGLGCGSGLALLMAAARGADVTGVESDSPERLSLARERLAARLAAHEEGAGAPGPVGGARLAEQPPARARAYSVVTSLEPVGCLTGDTDALVARLRDAAPLAERGAAVVLTGWGPPERCATTAVLRVAARLAEPRAPGSWRPAGRDDLEDVARRAGLVPDGSGRVSCPFGYAGTDSAVRGLWSTGLFDAAAAATDHDQVDKELREALHPYVRPDGTVWMPNVFRYLVARTR
ncbi:SAM-dependent methyltransferase [Streptomyces sp. NPDC002734]|uniref:SAM-dependent methyltransferase n=1 Tax=Streptomyces sp. NPDC002734 TaxID=3154426 RepID=UPI003318454C